MLEIEVIKLSIFLKLNNLIIIYIHDFVSTLGTSSYPPWRGNHSTCKPEGIRLTKAAARYGQDLSDLLGTEGVIPQTYKFWFVLEDTISE